MFENTKSQSDAEQLLRPTGELGKFVAGYAGPDCALVDGLYYALAHFLKDTRAQGVRDAEVTERKFSFFVARFLKYMVL